MSREIKFRAWDNRLKKFVQDFWLDSDGSLYYPNTDLPYETEEKLDNRNVRDLAPLMQYTGLTDKNGVEIFEGNIVRIIEIDVDDFSKDEEFIVEVYYERNPKSKYVSVYKTSFVAYNKSFYMEHALLYNKLWEYEIIGNIYENPELKGEIKCKQQ